MDSGPDHGNRDNPTLIGGDSGSPVYDRYYIGGTSNLILGAMGIADHERYKAGAPSQYGSHDVYFAVVKDSLPRLDADIYMP